MLTIGDEAIACLVKNGESNIKLAVLAFEKAIAVNSYVDQRLVFT
jgi:hypothetical protein